VISECPGGTDGLASARVFASVKGVLHQPEAMPALKQETRDAILLAIAKARSWIDDVVSGRVQSFAEIAEREGKVERHIRVLPAPPRGPTQVRFPGAVGIALDFPRLCRRIRRRGGLCRAQVGSRRRKSQPILVSGLAELPPGIDGGAQRNENKSKEQSRRMVPS
jgi:hypothetical protein